jgi:hypothetical protein
MLISGFYVRELSWETESVLEDDMTLVTADI